MKCVSVFKTRHLIPPAFSGSQDVSQAQRIWLSLLASILPKQTRSGFMGASELLLGNSVGIVCYAERLEMWERKWDGQMQTCSQRKEPLIWVLNHKQEFVKCAGSFRCLFDRVKGYTVT